MVNITRGRILEILRTKDSPVSGEKIGTLLGLSRVAVWKHIQGLRQAGYGIAPEKNGYLLSGDDDFLYPWEFPGREESIHWFKRTGSTMDEARGFPLREGSGASSLIVIAEEQIMGRGRLGRVWESGPGGLYFTLKLNVRVPLGILGRYSLTACAVLAETLNGPRGGPVRAKWPNDLLAGNRKVAGVLLDFRAEGDVACDVSIGVGVNISNSPQTARAVTLDKLLSPPPRRKELLSAFVSEFEKAAEDPLLSGAAQRWKAVSCTLGENVRLSLPEGMSRQGRALDLDDRGALIIRDSRGKLSQHLYADCVHKKRSTNEHRA